MHVFDKVPQRIAEHMRQPVLVDALNLLDTGSLQAAGFRYSSVGLGRRNDHGEC